MRYAWLFEALPGPQPCGPDLDETGDDEYLSYVLTAEDRLPARFYDRDTGAPFDRSNIDLKAEVAAISALLERSRDLRLLTLEARFHALAGQVAGFSECLQAIAGLVERHWLDVHPQPMDGTHTARQNLLAALDDRTGIILPLHYAPLVQDRRLGSLALRQYAVALGTSPPREEERVLDPGAVREAFAQPENREAAAAVHAEIAAARDALKRIRGKFVEEAGYESAPSFQGLEEALGQIAELTGGGTPAATAAAPGDAQPTGAEADASSGAVATAGAQPAIASP
ncbi:ImpA family type VI secretion system protein, partial [Propylenella binzhouense]